MHIFQLELAVPQVDDVLADVTAETADAAVDNSDTKAAAPTSVEDIEIPDHEIITRRKQFRMKKHKREKKAQKKADKQKAQHDKKTAKDARKQEKQKAKEAAKEAKLAAKAAKAEAKAKAKAKGKRSNKGEDHQDEDQGTKKQKEEGDKHQEAATTSPWSTETSPCKSPGKLHSRRLNQLRKLQSKLKEAKSPDKTQDANQECEDTAAEKTKLTTSNKKGTKGRKQTKKNAFAAGQAKKGQKRKHGKICKDDATESMAKKRKTASKNSKTPSKTKASPSKPPRKPSRTAKPKVTVEPDNDIKAQVLGVLQQCRDSNCTHPDFPEIQYCKATFELSKYWSRKVVGVKVNQKYVACGGRCGSTKKAAKSKSKKGGKCQVAYFGCPTICTYSNILLAGLYVACMHTLPWGSSHKKQNVVHMCTYLNEIIRVVQHE